MKKGVGERGGGSRLVLLQKGIPGVLFLQVAEMKRASRTGKVGGVLTSGDKKRCLPSSGKHSIKWAARLSFFLRRSHVKEKSTEKRFRGVVSQSWKIESTLPREGRLGSPKTGRKGQNITSQTSEGFKYTQ